MKRWVRALPLAFLALLVGSAPAQAATPPTVLATTTSATVVSAAAGWTVWSDFQAGKFVLTARMPDGTIVRPPVAPRGVPFDVDVDKDATGKPIAAYSRCSTEPRGKGGTNTVGPQWTSGKGCTIRLLDLATGKESKIKRSRTNRSEVLPSLSGRTLAYIGVPKSKRLKRLALLRTHNLRTGRSAVLDSGPRKAASVGFAEGPTSVDIQGSRVAVAWRLRNRTFNSFDTDIRVRRFGGRLLHPAGASNTEDCNYETVMSPMLAGDNLLFLDTTGSDWVLGRVPASATGKGALVATSYGPFVLNAAPPTVPTSSAVDGNRLIVADTATTVGGSPVGATRVLEYQIGAFTNKKPFFCA